MRLSGSILIALVIGVLVGGFVAGLSVYLWLDEEPFIQSPGQNTSVVATLQDRTASSPTITRDVPTGDLKPHLHIQSVHESTILDSDFDQSVSLYVLLARADIRDLERYVGESLKIASRNQRVAALSIIFGRYAALDPHQALDQALMLDQLTMQERSNLVRSIFNEWTVGDLDGAIAAIEDLPDPYTYAAASAIMWRSDFLSPDQRIQLAQQIGPNDDWIATTVASIRSEAAKVDPRNAFYDSIRDTSTHTQAHYAELLGIVRHWFELEGTAILTEINSSLDNRNTRRSVLNALIWNAIATNTATPTDVLNVVAEFPNRQDAKEAVQYVFRSWSNLDPKRSFESSFDLGNQFMDLNFRRSLLQMWATKDANGLFDEATSLPREYQDMAVVTALGRMSRNSPEEAIRIARNLDTSELRTQARNEIIGQWSPVNAKSAFEWVINDGLSISDENEPSIVQRAFSSYLSQDFESAERFARDYQGEMRNQLLDEVASRLVYTDIERAIEYLPILNKESRTDLQFQIGHQLVEIDPLEAVSFGATVEKSGRENYYKSVLNSWAYHDASELYENIDRIPREYRTYAADGILQYNENRKTLSDREIRNLEAMVTRRTRVLSDINATVKYRFGD